MCTTPMSKEEEAEHQHGGFPSDEYSPTVEFGV